LGEILDKAKEVNPHIKFHKERIINRKDK